MRVLSIEKVNPLIIPLDALRQVLAQAEEDMKRNPRLAPIKILLHIKQE